jgi:hypothetical protein
MPTDLSRRQVLAAGSAATLLLTAFPTFGSPDDSAPGPALWPAFPGHDPEIARSAVGASHGRLDELKALVDPMPELAKSAHDWGFGDWEDCIGAASHVGSRECAEYLIERGAHPTIFTYAMLGNLDAVRAAIAATPGIQRAHGPHGITLMRHAVAGGERAASVVEYLNQLGDADTPFPSLPFTDADAAPFLGTYAFGPGDQDVFIASIARSGFVIARAGAAPRGLKRTADAEFHPVGAPNVRLRFALEAGRAASLSVHNFGPVLTARRVSN